MGKTIYRVHYKRKVQNPQDNNGMYNITLETESVSRPGWPFECWNVWSFKLLFFFMWDLKVCVSMHVWVGRRLSGVSCLLWKWVLGARGSTRHQLSAGSFTTEPSQRLWDGYIFKISIKRPLKQHVCVWGGVSL